jgi:phosphoglycolate phosphatase-like HAD superfamily hydrolase
VPNVTATPISHVVWDWNGTILDDNHAVLAAVNAVCADYGREPVTLDEWRAIFRRPLLDCYSDLLKRPLTATEFTRIDRIYHHAYRPLIPTCGLTPGVPAELHRWRDNGGGQSLLSMWFHDELVPLVAEFGLTDLFDRIDGLRTDIGGAGSKAAHLIDHIAAQGLDPRDVLVIGDVKDDAVAAAQAGARCVLVTTGIESRAALRASGAPVVDTIADALRVH